MNKRGYVQFIILVLVVAGSLYLWSQRSEPRVKGDMQLRDRAWGTLEQYIEAAKNKDLETVTKLSYQISDVCKDPTQRAECDMRMGSVYYFGSNLKKDEFTNIYSDNKQIIMTTELKREEDKESINYSRGIIYFVIEDSLIKILKFNDSKGVSMSKEGRTVEEINTFLIKRMMDTDNDGIEDEVEECIGQPTDCIPTDPQKHDSDRDGWWDAIEAQFYK